MVYFIIIIIQFEQHLTDLHNEKSEIENKISSLNKKQLEYILKEIITKCKILQKSVTVETTDYDTDIDGEVTKQHIRVIICYNDINYDIIIENIIYYYDDDATSVLTIQCNDKKICDEEIKTWMSKTCKNHLKINTNVLCYITITRLNI